jgi:hypothetical protein
MCGEFLDQVGEFARFTSQAEGCNDQAAFTIAPCTSRTTGQVFGIR